MAKEDILLREEMGKLEIEPMKRNKSRSDENPFAIHKRGFNKRSSVQNISCPCSFQKKNANNGICKRKQNKILKEPVLQIIKNCVVSNSVDIEGCLQDASSSSSPNMNADTLNLCTLVKNCNQLKISCGSNEQLSARTCDKTKWWKNDTACSRDNRETRQTNQPGSSCSQQALNPPCDVTIDELASYFETLVHIPKKMSSMAEMMYI